MKTYRIDIANRSDGRIISIFIHAESMALAKHQASKLPYVDIDIIKVEQDTEDNYKKWLVWEYEPNKFENARYVNKHMIDEED